MEPKYCSSFQNAKSNGICVPTVFDSTFIEPSLDSTVLIILTLLKIAKKIQILHYEICGVYSRAVSIQMQGFDTVCRVTPAISWHFWPPVTLYIHTGPIICTAWNFFA